MFTYIDLFAGCGGLSEGFEQSGAYHGLAHVEWDVAAAKTLAKRLTKKWRVKDADKRVLVCDIRQYQDLIKGWSDPVFGSKFGLEECIQGSAKVDVLIGGPPCQAYSIAGRVRDEYGMQFDYRNFLFESYEKILTQFDYGTNTTTTNKVTVSEDIYNAIVPQTNYFSLPTGDVSIAIDKSAVSVYDYELDLNQQKRNIKILNSAYVNKIEEDFKKLMVN